MAQRTKQKKSIVKKTVVLTQELHEDVHAVAEAAKEKRSEAETIRQAIQIGLVILSKVDTGDWQSTTGAKCKLSIDDELRKLGKQVA